MPYEPKVSIIIPVKEINDYIRESIPYILGLDYKKFEILILPDEPSKEGLENTKIVPTGHIGPAQKRNIGAENAQGEILAFLDDDAYPKKDWLKKAVKHFQKKEIAAAGGPAVTPKNDSFWQKVSGAVFLSRFSGGNPERYWPIGRVKQVDDWPSVNLLVRKKDFNEVNGFNSNFWPGEDTLLCQDLIFKLNKKIIYDPQVLVYHHRRAGLLKHLRQIGQYGLHRGYLAKKYPKNSLKLKYFLPSLFFLFASIGWILLFLAKSFDIIYWLAWILYAFVLVLATADIFYKVRNIKIIFAVIPYIFLTHIVYGLKFIQGFVFTKRLKSKLR